MFLGIGTGHTAMRVMGMDAVKPKVFAEYLRVVRALLHGEEVEYTLNGVTKPIRFLHQDMGFFNVEQPVPIYVAANGPLALAAAGAYGDGRISAGGEPDAVFTNNLERVRAGAEAAGREFDDDFHTAALTFSCVLKPGEKLTSDRVIDQVGSMATASLHFWWELYRASGSDAFIRPEVRDVWDRYLAHVERIPQARTSSARPRRALHLPDAGRAPVRHAGTDPRVRRSRWRTRRDHRDAARAGARSG